MFNPVDRDAIQAFLELKLDDPVNHIAPNTLAAECLLTTFRQLDRFRHDAKELHAAIHSIPLPQALQDRLKQVHSEHQAWTKKHRTVLGTRADLLVHEACWSPQKNPASAAINDNPASFGIDHPATALKLIRRFVNDSEEELELAFHLAAVYSFRDIAVGIWARFSDLVRLMYLEERLHQFDPIVIFWTGICGGKPWLSDSYLVRAFYWAAEHNYVEALRFYWQFIAQERQEVVNFRSNRAIQLAANYGNIEIIAYLWSVTDEAQHKQMIQAVLHDTPGALQAFETAVQNGYLEIVAFLFREADINQRKLMIRHDEAAAFRVAADQGHTEIVRLFMQKSEIIEFLRFLLEAADCGAFQVAIFNGHADVLTLLWAAAARFPDVQKRFISIQMKFRTNFGGGGGKNGLVQASEVLQPIWSKSSDELKQLLILKQLVVHVTKQLVPVPAPVPAPVQAPIQAQVPAQAQAPVPQHLALEFEKFHKFQTRAPPEEDSFSLKDYLINFEIPFLIRMDRIADVTARLCDVVSNYRDMVKGLLIK